MEIKTKAKKLARAIGFTREEKVIPVERIEMGIIRKRLENVMDPSYTGSLGIDMSKMMEGIAIFSGLKPSYSMSTIVEGDSMKGEPLRLYGRSADQYKEGDMVKVTYMERWATTLDYVGEDFSGKKEIGREYLGRSLIEIRPFPADN